MYSGKYINIENAEYMSGMSVRELLKRGTRNELAIYAYGDWLYIGMEYPFDMHSVDSPILMDDEKHLEFLLLGGSITLQIDADGRFICRRGATDEDYLDGVKITQANLHCLKSEIEALTVSQTESLKAPADDVSSRSDRGKARTRKTNLIRAIEAAVTTFDKKPSFDDLCKFFDDGGDSTGFIEDSTEDKLVWRDTKGKFKDTKKSTVRNHLSRMKS